MRWDDFRRSDNVEDRREEGGFGGGMSGGGGLPIGQGGLGIGTIVVLGLLGWALGIDPRILISGASMINGGGSAYEDDAPPPRANNAGVPQDSAGSFVSAVLGEIDDRWSEIFRESGSTYRGARIILYSRATRAACGGVAQAAMGPFYCPQDRQIYLDTAFFREIETRFKGCSGKACQFTYAYVIAHEAGHHVQNLLGILPRVQRAQQAAGSQAESNQLQVRVELQADCFAGVWAAREKQKRPDFLEEGDIDAALQTAAAIGDDTLQRRMQGRVVPDSFTHGSAEQRKRWFSTGFQNGTVASCNTFSGARI